jgi:hypothetical protein
MKLNLSNITEDTFPLPSPAEYTNNYSTVGNTYTDKYTSTL